MYHIVSTLYQGFVISGVRNTRTSLYQRLVTLEVRYIRDSSYWGFDMARISWMGWGGRYLGLLYKRANCNGGALVY